MKPKRQTIRNFIFNSISLIISIILGLFYTPYLVKSLGIVAYGIVPLALIMNQYISVITGSLTGSLTRFYTLAFQQKNYFDASKYLSSSFIAISAIIATLAPLFILIVLKIDSFFNIPPEYVKETKLLFAFTILSFILSLYSSLYNITLYSLNRLDLMNVIKIARLVLKIVITVIFFESLKKNISYIGYANFLSELVVIVMSRHFFYNTTNRNIKIAHNLYEKAALTGILTMTIWVFLHQLGDTGLYRTDNVLVNHFWSTRESGILGALSEFGTYVMIVIAVITSLSGPLILNAYSNNNHTLVKKLTTDHTLIVGIISSFLVGIMIGFAKPIISLWLGKEYASYSNWFIMKQITLPFYAASGVYAYVFRAWNRVIFPAVSTLIFGTVNLLLSYIICIKSAGSENFIFFLLLVSSFFIMLQSYGLNAYSFYRLYPEVKIKTPLLLFFKILFGLVVTIIIAKSYSDIFEVTNIFELGLGIVIVTVIFTLIGYTAFLNRPQKQFVIDYMKSGYRFFRN